MAQHSAGILLFRWLPHLEVLIGHMGGPFWAGKDTAAWSIPKGAIELGEEPLAAALREFSEELGRSAPAGTYDLLGDFIQRSGKVVTVFCAEGDFDADEIVSGTFAMEWPPRSGHFAEFAEIDEARWMTVAEARPRLVVGQAPVLDALSRYLGRPDSG